MGTTKRPVVYFCLSFILRMFLIVASTISAVTMVTGNETKDLYDPVTGYGTYSVKFTDSPSFIYFVAALSVAGVYGIITKLSSCLVICLAPASSIMLVLFAFFDVLILGVVASATGSAGSTAYSIFQDNSDPCSTYNRFCLHLGVAFGFALLASVLLVILLWTSLISLYKRIPKQTLQTPQPPSLSPLQTPPQVQTIQTPHAPERTEIYAC